VVRQVVAADELDLDLPLLDHELIRSHAQRAAIEDARELVPLVRMRCSVDGQQSPDRRRQPELSRTSRAASDR
jgi:hypothetical protein